MVFVMLILPLPNKGRMYRVVGREYSSNYSNSFRLIYL